jgi:hypothetical protein
VAVEFGDLIWGDGWHAGLSQQCCILSTDGL